MKQYRRFGAQVGSILRSDKLYDRLCVLSSSRLRPLLVCSLPLWRCALLGCRWGNGSHWGNTGINGTVCKRWALAALTDCPGDQWDLQAPNKRVSNFRLLFYVKKGKMRLEISLLSTVQRDVWFCTKSKDNCIFYIKSDINIQGYSRTIIKYSFEVFKLTGVILHYECFYFWYFHVILLSIFKVTLSIF